ncbi:MAG: peptidylprolyl isomerase [Chloroflexota bacterium]
MIDDRGQKPVVHTKKHLARLERERRQIKLIQYLFFGVLVFVIGMLVYGYLDTNIFQLQKPVAKVGDVEISRKDFQIRIRIERASLINNYFQYSQFAQMFGMDMSAQLEQIQAQLDSAQTLGSGAIDALVNEELIRQEAAKRGITASAEEIEEAIHSSYQYFPSGSPTPANTLTPPVYPTLSDDIYQYITPSPTITTTPEATATLEATATVEPSSTPTSGPTVTGTIEPSLTPTATIPPPTDTPTPSPTVTPSPTFTATPSPTVDPNLPTETPLPTSTPYTLDGFKTEYQKGLAYFAKYGLDEARYRAFFETDILRKKLYEEVTKDIPAVEEQVWARHILVNDEAVALAIIERIEKGEDFGTLAAELSTDTGSGAQGGDLGWFGRGAMVATFEEAAFSLETGEISQPVQSEYGYHIIQVIARQDRPLSEEEWQQARDTAFAEFLQALRADYTVTIMDDWLPYVPDEPNFFTVGTEAAITATAEARKSPTPLP